jgi:murein DD-endopeptidase MepM/ murein hydrolase activator NlpD
VWVWRVRVGIIMGRETSRRGTHLTLRFGALTAVAVGAAACSSEAVRLSDNPNASPYATAPANYAAAPANQMVAQPAPVGRIERQPLYQPPPPPPPPAPTSEVTGTVRTGGHWDWQGGTPVVVAHGETIAAIAHRHNVPAHEIMRANGLNASSTLQAGQRLVIPRYVADGGSAKLAHAALPRHPAPPAAAVAAVAAPASPSDHVVASGETLSSIARKHRITIRELATANSMTPETPLKVGMKLNVPARTGAPTRTASLAPTAPAVPAPAPAKQTLQSVKPAEQPAASARIATPATEATADEPGPAAAAGMPSFRWPLRGRVTTNFGSKTVGGASDGIDLAVPEGTAVRAADDGVVAYAGNELKGYGNLVLIRHANGFVTAYANASEINVKRNDQVHRGQVIAKSGQTGTAATPQLHFEIRKNSAPVDPMQYLPSDKTASAPL